jgi:putative DNA primase/helicase
MNGLIRPNVVTEATTEYFAEQDLVSHWIEESCDLGPNKCDTLAALFKSWGDFAMANGEKQGSSKWFSQTLTRLGCESVKSVASNRGKRGFKGICVRPVVVNDRTQSSAPS